MATVSTVYSLVSASCDQWDGYFVKPVQYDTSRKRKRTVKKPKRYKDITGYLRLSPTDVHIRVDSYGIDWDVRFRRALDITELIKCNRDGDDYMYEIGNMDVCELFRGCTLSEMTTDTHFPPRRQLQHARRGDIGFEFSEHREPVTLFVFRNKTVFAAECWRLLARHVRFTRPIALYLQGLAVAKSCAPNGAGRLQDLNCFIADDTSAFCITFFGKSHDDPPPTSRDDDDAVTGADSFE